MTQYLGEADSDALATMRLAEAPRHRGLGLVIRVALSIAVVGGASFVVLNGIVREAWASGAQPSTTSLIVASPILVGDRGARRLLDARPVAPGDTVAYEIPVTNKGSGAILGLAVDPVASGYLAPYIQVQASVSTVSSSSDSGQGSCACGPAPVLNMATSHFVAPGTWITLHEGLNPGQVLYVHVVVVVAENAPSDASAQLEFKVAAES